MATFAELRDRFSDDEHKRGKQFERVCKWFLETDSRYSDRLVNVWLWDDWPGRWGPDCGIDLVAEDRDGRTWAIQAKCYDPKYSVTKSDIDKFLSESTNENIHHRLLIATTDHLGKNARSVIHRGDKVIPVSQVLLAGLETAPVIWPSDPARLRGGGPRKPVKRWPHQTEAINNVTKNLGKRGQMISACGTGKTLAALWISERLEAKRTLVLLPSLTLLSQTVSEWLANTKEPFAYLPVCSDDTVSRGNDAAVLFTSDLEYPVTTNPDDIATFLRKRGRQVVFSTYQSSHQIAEAQTRSRVPAFDLVIADEAHRCAGKVSSAYGTVLDDEAIRAKKRLFMTATPRTYTATVKKKAGDEGIEIASMDDEVIFGPVVHRLNFGEAIERGLLTDYQVVIVGVDDDTYKQMVDQRRLVETDTGIETDAKTLAGHIALAKTIRDYGLRRTITFHSRIKTASEFANLLPEVVSWMPPRHQPKGELVTDHVSGEMTTGERNRRLNRLRNLEPGQSAVLTNCACLSEGIDVPALDGVAFIDPRRSQVDIIQAVGRAIRLSQDKTVGTIILPVFLSETGNPDTALNSSEFEPVWSIVKALRAHDEHLAEQLDQFRYQLGRTGKPGPWPGKIVFDLPLSLPKSFVTALRTVLVEQTTATWDFWFGLLGAYTEREGTSRVPQAHVEEGMLLGAWTSSQRFVYANGKMLEERCERLERLPDWAWDLNEAQWQEAFALLKSFVAREHHPRVPQGHLEDGFRLGTWASNQKGLFTKGMLQADRQAQLESFPQWVWDEAEAHWAKTFERLVAYSELHGHSRIKSTEVVDGFRLGQWVSVQRNRYRAGKLGESRIARLEPLPKWAWDYNEAAWEEAFERLEQFSRREGHTNPSRNHREDGFHLISWIQHQRRDFRDRKLDRENAARLEALPGWSWDPLSESWERAISALAAFAEREGHSLVPARHVEDGYLLGGWVTNQRNRYQGGKVPPERVRELESMTEWRWDIYGPQWSQNYELLVAFQVREGHLNVPNKHREGEVTLGYWVGDQRKRYKDGRLEPDRISRLEALEGWAWDAKVAQWEVGHRAFKAFVAREGHSSVPRDHVENGVRLNQWIGTNRTSHRRGTLDQEIDKRLEETDGWLWGTKPEEWNRTFAALRQYVERSRSVRIPRGHRENGREIRNWVYGQKRKKRAGTLSDQQIADLESLPGWTWE
jgi:superfamily II DNA or RNA helicase